MVALPVSLVAAGTAPATTVSATSTPLAYPAGNAEGDLLVAILVVKVVNATTPTSSGWTLAYTSGKSATGVAASTGVGEQTVFVLTRTVPAGGLSGSATFAAGSPTPNNTNGRMLCFRYDSSATVNNAWSAVTGTSFAHASSTTWGGTGAANLSISTGDQLVCALWEADDTARSGTPNLTLTATGATLDTLVDTGHNVVTTGGDSALDIFSRGVTAGTSSAAPVATLTGAAAETGGGIFLRISATGDPAIVKSANDPVGVTDSISIVKSVVEVVNDPVSVTDGDAPPATGATYYQTAWNSPGTDVIESVTAYKDITVTVEVGDLIVVSGHSANANGGADSASLAQVGGTGTVGSWTRGSYTNVTANCGYTAGHAVATVAGTVTVRATVHCSSTAFMGVAAWVVPAGEWTGTPTYTPDFTNDDVDGQLAKTLAVTSKVFYAAADWTALAPGSGMTPAGGTQEAVYSDGSTYAVMTAHWDAQAAGTRNYGPSAAAGDRWGGVVIGVQEATPSGGGADIEVGKNPADTVGVTDSIDIVLDAGGTTYTPSPDDPVAISDVATPVQDQVRSANDPVGILDARTIVQGVDRSASDPVGATDAYAIGVTRTASDPVGVSDAPAAVQAVVRSSNDPVEVTDAALAVQAAARSLDDAVGVLDVPASTQDLARTHDEAVAVTDSMDAQLTLGGVSYDRTPDDPVAIADTAAWEQTRTAADAVAITDASVLSRAQQLSDAVTLTDASVLSRALQLSDSVGASDASSVSRETSRADAVGVTDAVAVVLEVSRTASDAVGATDAATKARELGLADVVGATDAASQVAALERTASDTVGVLDAAGYEIGLPVSATDAVGITDSVTVVRTVVSAVTDAVGVSDTAARAQILSRSVADIASASDVSSVTAALSRAPSDTVGVTDAADPQLTAGGTEITRTPADAVGVTDSVTVVMVRNVTVDELVGVADATSRVALRQLLVNDPVGITDIGDLGLPATPVSHVVFVEQPVTHVVFDTPPRTHLVFVEVRSHIVGLPPDLWHVVILEQPLTHIVVLEQPRTHVTGFVTSNT